MFTNVTILAITYLLERLWYKEGCQNVCWNMKR